MLSVCGRVTFAVSEVSTDTHRHGSRQHDVILKISKRRAARSGTVASNRTRSATQLYRSGTVEDKTRYSHASLDPVQSHLSHPSHTHVSFVSTTSRMPHASSHNHFTDISPSTLFVDTMQPSDMNTPLFYFLFYVFPAYVLSSDVYIYISYHPTFWLLVHRLQAVRPTFRAR